MNTFTRQRSDSELDSEWQPSGRRPQSTMAKHFSLALDDLFKMDNSIADLDAAVDEKYFSRPFAPSQTVNIVTPGSAS